MAKFTNRAVFFLYLVFIFSLLLAVSAQRKQFSVKLGKGIESTGPDCTAVYGAEEGDTCAEIAKAAAISDAFFAALNPNLNCDAIFIGQWLCVDGTV